jgi:hypothetical protein
MEKKHARQIILRNMGTALTMLVLKPPAAITAVMARHKAKAGIILSSTADLSLHVKFDRITLLSR